MRHITLLFLSIWLTSANLWAEEGMWLPLMLNKYPLAQMQAKGFQLSADDIYSINQACLKDAVVIFGRGCTGEVISDKGLLLTNYHCGLESVQSLSSLEHDYLTDGFWAKNADEEMTIPELSVTFLKRMEDVTDKVLTGISDTLTEPERQKIILANIAEIEAATPLETGQKAEVKSFFQGNQYFLQLTEIFEDIRIVGAPPASIGKFGGDTDNWMWPRHTGDFCVFRIYADSLNHPAKYSPQNTPYHPLKHLDISIKDRSENDFTMVLGFPYSTNEYVPSFHIEMLRNHIYPSLIDIRQQKLDIINHRMQQSPEIRLKYASKQATIANGWKKWKGEIRGLDDLQTIAAKQKYEAAFVQRADSEGIKSGSAIISKYRNLYADYTIFKLAETCYNELIWRNGMELVQFAGEFTQLQHVLTDTPADTAAIGKQLRRIAHLAPEFFKDYSLSLDKEMTTALLVKYRQLVPEMFHPIIYTFIDKQFKGNTLRYVEFVMAHTQLSSLLSVQKMLDDKPNKLLKIIESDPAIQLYLSFFSVYSNHIYPSLSEMNNELSALNREYMAAQMALEPERNFYPDANQTLRLTYGEIKGYDAADAVQYFPFSTMDGMFEKASENNPDYRLPNRLRALYQQKDFGRYEANNTLPVCFIASNHTTGGNSGSPVLDSQGRLIGINFDRAWEGVMSDWMYNPAQSRNISVDIRFVLWFIEKYAGAGYLLDEMTIVD